MINALEVVVVGSPLDPRTDVVVAGDEIPEFRYVAETIVRKEGETYSEFEKRAIARSRAVEKGLR